MFSINSQEQRRSTELRLSTMLSFQVPDLDEKNYFVVRHMQIYDNYMLFGRQRYTEKFL